MSTIFYCSRRCEETGDKTLTAGLKAYIATEGVCAGAKEKATAWVVCVSVLQHGPRVSLGCRSNELLDHANVGRLRLSSSFFSSNTLITIPRVIWGALPAHHRISPSATLVQ